MMQRKPRPTGIILNISSITGHQAHVREFFEASYHTSKVGDKACIYLTRGWLPSSFSRRLYGKLGWSWGLHKRIASRIGRHKHSRGSQQARDNKNRVPCSSTWIIWQGKDWCHLFWFLSVGCGWYRRQLFIPMPSAWENISRAAGDTWNGAEEFVLRWSGVWIEKWAIWMSEMVRINHCIKT